MDAARSRQDLRHGQSSRLHAARHSKWPRGLDDQDRRGQAEHADADHDGGDEVHHRQSDLERAALDRGEGVYAGAATGSNGAGAHGPSGQHQSGRHRSHLAAPGRRKRARPARFNFPNKFLVYQHDTPNKHLVRPRQKRAQPRLHARAGSGEICRGTVVDRRPGEGYTEDRIRKMFGQSQPDIGSPNSCRST